MLSEVVAPALPDGYARSVLSAAVDALGRLDRQWDTTTANLLSEIAELEELLGITADVPIVVDNDLAGLSIHHEVLRGQLEARILAVNNSSGPLSPDAVAIREYLRRAASRWGA
jgi:hypothetical protein